jgi:hypothetical protein
MLDGIILGIVCRVTACIVRKGDTVAALHNRTSVQGKAYEDNYQKTIASKNSSLS